MKLDDSAVNEPVYTEATLAAWRARHAPPHKGGPGSGFFGHAGRPGEVGGSESDGGGVDLTTWEGEGGALHHEGSYEGQDGDIGTLREQAMLHAQAVAGIDAVTKLEAQVQASVAPVSSDDGDEDEDTPPEIESWDDVSSDSQDKVESAWKQDASESSDYYDDVNLDPEDFIDHDELQSDARAGLETALRQPSNSELANIDLDTIDTLTSDGVESGDNVRTTDDKPLTDDQRSELDRLAGRAYDDAHESARDGVYETSGYQEAESQAIDDAINDAWNNLSDSEKFTFASDHDIELEADTPTPPSPPVTTAEGKVIFPDTWTPLEGKNSGDPDALRTNIAANALVDARTQEVLAARGLIEPNGTFVANPKSGYYVEYKEIAPRMWNAWKVSSGEPLANALQLAATEELGGVSRLTDAQKAAAIDAAEKNFGGNGMRILRGYSRAEYDTTQYLLAKAGLKEVEVYRGLILPTSQIESTPAEVHQLSPDRLTVSLPKLTLQRNGLQSTTTKREVANSWAGVDVPIREGKTERVVVRMRVPASSVFSVPAFGKNIHSEAEVVVLGSKGHWAWDVFKDHAPTLAELPLKHLAVVAKTYIVHDDVRLVVDLMAADQGRHWLTKEGGNPTGPSVKEDDMAPPPEPAKKAGVVYLEKFSEDEPRDDHGRWTDGGGGGDNEPATNALSARLHQPDAGFTYHAVTGQEPKTGYALSVHKGHERVLPVEEVNADVVATYARENWRLLMQPENYIGGWHNPEDGKVYLDISTVVSTPAEAEALGRANSQLAYFDLEQGHSVPIDPHGKAAHVASRRPTGRPAHLRGHSPTHRGADRAQADPGGNRASAADVGGRGSRRGEEDVAKFSEDQPRDDHGRWTDAGGGSDGGGGGESSRDRGRGEATPQERSPRRPGPTHRGRIGDGTLHSPGDALHSLANGEKVNIASEDVHEFLEKAAKRDDDPDLTDVHVEGHLIFGGNGLGIARSDMPQIPDDHRAAFLKSLRDEGLKPQKAMVDPLSLKPVQKEISARRVGQKMLKTGSADSTRRMSPIMVSNDGYVLDGHHRWAQMAALALDRPGIKMPVYRLGTGHARALRLMHAYTAKHGIANESISARAVPGVVYLAPDDPFAEVPWEEAPVEAVRGAGAWTRIGSIAGPPGTSVDFDRVRAEVARLVERALRARPAPRDGRDGKDGKDGAPGLIGPAGPQGLQGPRGERGLAGSTGPTGPTGLPGQKGLDGAAGPQGPPGERGAEGAVGPSGLVGARGEKGLDGRDGTDGAAGSPGERGAEGAAGPAGPVGEKGLDGRHGTDGKDGVGLAGAAVTRDGTLLVTMTDGRTQDLGPVVGKDGRDGHDGAPGAPGLGFDDLVVEHDGERRFTLKAQRGELVKELGTFTVPATIYRGVWRPEQTYAYQDSVTWGGSQWTCLQASGTTAKPGDPGPASRAWVMSVRKGDVGKTGPAGERGVRGEKGEQGARGPERW